MTSAPPTGPDEPTAAGSGPGSPWPGQPYQTPAAPESQPHHPSPYAGPYYAGQDQFQTRQQHESELLQPVYASPPEAFAAPMRAQAPPPAYYGPSAAHVSVRGFGIVGAIITLVGAAAVFVSFVSMSWLSADSGHITFRDLHNLLGVSEGNAPRLTDWYFNWLAWATLGVVFVLALIANAATENPAPLRVLGVLVGLGGAVITFFALKTDGVSLHALIDQAGPGFWVAISGFVVMAIGASIGPRYIRGN
jgi:magnesium-transporting ATPase (P-type)